jgi:hypothetical protein
MYHLLTTKRDCPLGRCLGNRIAPLVSIDSCSDIRIGKGRGGGGAVLCSDWRNLGSWKGDESST